MSKHPIREVVAVFNDSEMLEKAIWDLESQGIKRGAFTLLANEDATKKKLGERYRRVDEMEDNPSAPRETFFAWASRQHDEFGLVPAFVFAGAVVGVALGGAPLPFLIATGSGGIVGVALRQWIRRFSYHAVQLHEQLERGGLLLWVNVRDHDEEKKATAILKAHKGQHVHAHDLAHEALATAMHD